MIELDHVSKSYGGIPALRDVSLRVPAGHIVGLLGRNGAGKSTALNLMTGYFPPSSGRVRVCGEDMLASPRSCKRKIGYLPEHPPLYDEMTVEEYLRFVSALREVKNRAIPAHVEEILSLCALTEVRRRLIGHLSKGYRQRTGLAQALCGAPEILILDEPTVGLDPAQTAEARDLIRRLGQEHTVLFSSHILSEVQLLCSHVLILEQGRLVRSLSLDPGSSSAPRLRLRAAGDMETLLPALRALPGIRSVDPQPAPEGAAEFILSLCPDTAPDPARDRLFRLLASLDAPIRLLREEQDTLEEIFLSAVKGGEDS